MPYCSLPYRSGRLATARMDGIWVVEDGRQYKVLGARRQASSQEAIIARRR
jgi:hypothetical protein